MASGRPAAHRDILYAAVQAAVMAPSSHNTQPWRFRIVGSNLELLVDRGRQLEVIDRERRQQIQSCGCALYNARVTVRAMGYLDEIAAVLAEPERPDLLAILRLGQPYLATHLDHALYAAIPRRRTNRRPFLSRPVASAITDQLIAAAADAEATMIRLLPDQKRALAHLVDEADRQQYRDPEFRAELGRWLVPTGSTRRDGIPFVEKEYGTALPFSVMRTLRTSALGAEFGTLEDELVSGSPVVAILGTRYDEPAEWFACGQALQAVLLLATTFDLSAAFLNQVLELPELRRQIAALAPEVGYPHMVVRLGHPEDPVRHPAPRRPVEDVLEIVG